MSRLQDEYHPYAVEEPDEVDVLLHGTPDRKGKLIRECLTESEPSSEDEFEKEMEAELNSTIKTMEDKNVGTSLTKYYNDIYFDSDSEDEDKTLLCDTEKDNRDQASRPHPPQQPVPNSDAVLNCLDCMTTLSVFVMNCSVNKKEVLGYKIPENRKKRQGRKMMRSNHEDAAELTEAQVEIIYHLGMCTEYSPEVATYDKDEVFHFFRVLASYSFFFLRFYLFIKDTEKEREIQRQRQRQRENQAPGREPNMGSIPGLWDHALD
ncbi:unnamed protein product [Nyctereutes procyonoides]|uniref:(raccoon dog) hypothetical protein n=1 Tax=Nyctereutes procyonoides TaxID=34880 RepID=A0A811YCH8_NYCPR|nr:unnamed protein product [Nyctereutes procyonoides]